MQVNVAKLIELAKNKNWSMPELANKLNIDYSYLFRIIKHEKKGGAKLFTGLYQLCKDEGLNIDDFIFLTKPLSTDNGIKNVAAN